MATKETKKRVTFAVEAGPNSEVFLAGTFNGWNASKKQLKESKRAGTYSGTVMLPKNQRFEYKFVINGDWCTDPASQELIGNDKGSENSLITT